jgi:hypothetical protein
MKGGRGGSPCYGDHVSPLVFWLWVAGVLLAVAVRVALRRKMQARNRKREG